MDLPDHKDYDNTGLTKPVSRTITAQEREWIKIMLQANGDWADVTIGDLAVNCECTCGCRTAHLQHPAEPQNPKTSNLKWEHVGEIWIETKGQKSIEIGLFATYGKLCELEVVCEQGTEPVPPDWEETSRKIW